MEVIFIEFWSIYIFVYPRKEGKRRGEKVRREMGLGMGKFI